jgi:hypothetical protein
MERNLSNVAQLFLYYKITKAPHDVILNPDDSGLTSLIQDLT